MPGAPSEPGRRLLQVVTEHAPGGLAYAQLVQRLAIVAPDAPVNAVVVAAGAGLAAGLCVAQLALSEGPAGLVIVCDVDGGERIWLGRTWSGVLIVGPGPGFTWSFVAGELDDLVCLDVTGRDALALGVGHALAHHPHAARAAVPRDAVPAVPDCAVAWIDRDGNVEITLSDPPCPPGRMVQVRIGAVGETAVALEDRRAVSDGQLALVPGRHGWPTREHGRRRLLELSVGGGSAAERFRHPQAGEPVAVSPVRERVTSHADSARQAPRRPSEPAGSPPP